METSLILYPSFALFALTIGSIFYMGHHRYRAIHAREISISYYRAYDTGTQPERLHIINRHVQNHFEVPPLLHLGVLTAYVTNSVTVAALCFAWLFVLARYVHTVIHLGSNNVSVRFFTFGFSLLMLTGLWASVFWCVVSGQ